MKISKLHIAIVALILTNIIWGASAPIFKWSLENISPFTLAFLRFFLAALLLLPFRIKSLIIPKNEFLALLPIAFFGFFLHISLILFGLKFAPSINLPIIASSAPIFLIIASRLVLNERIKRKVIFGSIISLIGVLVITLQPILSDGFQGSIIGNILFITGIFMFVIYTILLKEFKTSSNFLTITFWLFAISSFFFLPFFLWENQQQSFITQINLNGIVGIIFGSVFTSTIAYVLFNFAIRYIKTNETGIFLYIDPIIATLIAMPLLGEKITALFILGSFLVLSGIVISERRLNYHPVHLLFKNNKKN